MEKLKFSDHFMEMIMIYELLISFFLHDKKNGEKSGGK